MPKQSANPSPSARRSRRSYALRNIGCASCKPVISGGVITLQIQAGKLSNRESHTEVEIDRAKRVPAQSGG